MMRSLFLILFLNFILPGVYGDQPDVGIHAAFNEFSRRERESFDTGGGVTDLERAKIMEESYEKEISPYISGAESISDLKLLFRASYTAYFYTLSEDYLRHMKNSYEALSEKMAVSESETMQMLGALTSDRRFDEVAEFIKSKNLKHRAPILRERNGHYARSLLEIENPYLLTRIEANLDKSIAVLVISHPACRFSQNAISDIQSDAELAGIFKKYGKFVAPQDQTFNFDQFSEWNLRHKDYPICIAYKRKEFSDIDNWGTPTFYFIYDGRIVEKIIGWPKGGKRKEIIVAFNRISGLSR